MLGFIGDLLGLGGDSGGGGGGAMTQYQSVTQNTSINITTGSLTSDPTTMVIVVGLVAGAIVLSAALLRR